MNGPSRGSRWARVLVAAIFALVVGIAAYNAGFAQGVAQQLPAGAVAAAYPYRPWGFGFGFLIPLFFGFVLLRFLFWGGPWRRGWYGGYYGRGCDGRGASEVPPAFDEWHRRAHERDRQQPPPVPTT